MISRRRILSRAAFVSFAFYLILFSSIALAHNCLENFAKSVVFSKQGRASDGSSVPSGQSDPASALGPPGAKSGSFNLGIGGTLVLKFSPPLVNLDEVDDLTIVNASVNGAVACDANPERADIYASYDGVTYSLLGTICLGATLDLGPLHWAQYIKIVDRTDPQSQAFQGKVSYGFTLDAVTGRDCVRNKRCASAAKSDPEFSNVVTERALFLNSIGNDFVFSEGAVFEEYTNGSARLEGMLYRLSDVQQAMYMVGSFTGKVSTPPAGSPKLTLLPEAYSPAGGPVDATTWYYYRKWAGSLVGLLGYTGKDGAFVQTGAFQVGSGANGLNIKQGASGELSFVPSGGATTGGGITVDLESCSFGSVTPTPSSTPTRGATATPGSMPTGTLTHTPTASPTTAQSATPTPIAPPSGTNRPSGTPLATPTPTPEATSTSPVGVLTPTPVPTTTKVPSGPICEDDDVGPELGDVDVGFLNRRQTVILVGRLPSAAGRDGRFDQIRAAALKQATALYRRGWTDIWSVPSRIVVCGAGPSCKQVSHMDRIMDARSVNATFTSLISELTAKVRPLLTRRQLSKLRRIAGSDRTFESLIEARLRALPTVSIACDQK